MCVRGQAQGQLLEALALVLGQDLVLDQAAIVAAALLEFRSEGHRIRAAPGLDASMSWRRPRACFRCWARSADIGEVLEQHPPVVLEGPTRTGGWAPGGPDAGGGASPRPGRATRQKHGLFTASSAGLAGPSRRGSGGPALEPAAELRGGRARINRSARQPDWRTPSRARQRGRGRGAGEEARRATEPAPAGPVREGLDELARVAPKARRATRAAKPVGWRRRGAATSASGSSGPGPRRGGAAAEQVLAQRSGLRP